MNNMLMTGSNGLPVNYDNDKGIHYGVINQNRLHPEAVDDIIRDGIDIYYEQTKQDVLDQTVGCIEDIDFRDEDGWKEQFKTELMMQLRDMCSHRFIEGLYDAITTGESLVEYAEFAKDYIDEEFGACYECDGTSYWYEHHGYKIRYNTDDGDMFVIDSPYFTYCRQCSPCAPNAGYLTDQPGTLKTFCLGTDWFEDDEAPYDIYEVYSGKCIYRRKEAEDEA